MNYRDWPVSARWLAILVLLVSGLTYLPSLTGGFVWDDFQLVGSQQANLTGLVHCFTRPFLSCYYRPLVSASVWLDYLHWGGTPLGYHQTNLVLHVLTTAALMAFLAAAFRRPAIALWGGAAFAVQPVQVSTTAWIGGRTDSLAALFVVLFAWLLVAGARSSGPSQRRYLVCAVLAYMAAVFTKEQNIALAPLIPLAFWCFRDRTEGDPPIAHVLRSRPCVLTTAGCGVGILLFLWAWHRLGVPLPLTASDGAQAVLARGGRTVTYYTLLSVAPTPKLMHLFCLDSLERAGAWPVVLGFAVLAACAAGLAAAWRRDSRVAWLLGLVLLALLPVCNFAPIPTLLIAPYRAGVAGLGTASLLALLFANLPRIRRPVMLAAYPAAAFWLVWCFLLTAWGARQWSDEERAFTTIASYDPGCNTVRLNLANVLVQKGRWTEAAAQIEETLDRTYGSRAWTDSRTAAAALHDDPRILARIHDNQGGRLVPEKWLSDVFTVLGDARFGAKDFAQAERAYATADVFHSTTDTLIGLGRCARRAGRLADAEQFLRRAAAMTPNRSGIEAELGETLAAAGKLLEAKALFRRCIERQPGIGDGYLKLADVQQRMGDRAGAAATLRAALRQSPHRSDIRQMLARL